MNNTTSKPFGYFCLPISRSTLESLALLSILVLGAALRFWNISIGLPTLYVHDEIFEVHRALELLRGEYNFYRTKGMYFYFLSIMSGCYGAWLVFQGHFSDLSSFITYSLVHPGDIVLLSRILTAVLGTCSIFLIYRLGKIIFPHGSPAPLLLALVWATCGLAVWLSKWGLIETTLLLFGLLSFFPILHLLHEKSQKNYLLAGVCIAAATATKIYGAVLIVPLVFAHLVGQEKPLSFDTLKRQTKGLVLFAIIFGVSLSIFNPAIPLKILSQGIIQGIIPTSSTDAPETFPIFFYFKYLRWNLGNIGLPIFAVGLVMAVVRFQKHVCACAIFACVFFLALGLRPEAMLVYDRYLLISLPFFFVVTIYGVEVVREKILSVLHHDTTRGVASVGVVVLAAIVFFWNGLSYLLPNPVFGTPWVPVQVQAVQWFEEYVPEGATVVVRGERRPWPGNQDIPIYDLEGNYLRRYEEKTQHGGTPAEFRFMVDLAKAKDILRYNLIVEDRYAIWKPLQHYIQLGAEYFVVNEQYFEGKSGSKRSLKAMKSRRTFYQALRSSSGVTRINTFQGKTVTGSHRTIEVYQVRDPKRVLSSTSPQ